MQRTNYLLMDDVAMIIVNIGWGNGLLLVWKQLILSNFVKITHNDNDIL